MNKQTLIKNLNDDLAAEYTAIIQYITYAALATGPYRPQLVKLFLEEVNDEQAHAQFLANKIVALGGRPATKPNPVKDAKTEWEMLEVILEDEKGAVQNYTRRAKEAEESGDKGLALQLEDMIKDEAGHAEEIERILRNWPIEAEAA